ncbi:MAG TPA: CHAT domain-containing protein, partial [Blastocatellia bacterium]|nr:CHAT domain-containing protein [Blastocatellia bacterium]
LQCSTKARDLAERTSQRLGLAASLNAIALQYYSVGSLLKAHPVFGQALSIFEETKDRKGQAEVLLNLGYTLADLGNPKQAIDSFQKSVKLAAEVNDKGIQALGLTATGLINSVLGEKKDAFNFHNQALEIFRATGNRHGEAVTDNGIANLYYDIGENQKALRSYARALHLLTETGEPDFEALTMGSIGTVYLGMKEPRQALIWCKRGLALPVNERSRWVITYNLNDIGRCYYLLGDTNKALEYYNRALKLEEELGDRRGKAYSLNRMGAAYEKLGKPAKALLDYKEALALFREVAHGEGELEALHNLARLERDTGDIESAYKDAQLLIGLVETQRLKVAGQEFRTAYFASVHEHYELYRDVLMRMHRQHPSASYDVMAFNASEAARARSLVDMLRETRTDIREGVPPDLLQRERDLQNSLNAKAARLSVFLGDKASQQEVASLRNELTDLTTQYDSVEAQIRADSPRYAALTQPQVPGLNEIQKNVLDRDTLLLEYSLGKERSYLWAVTQGSMDSYELPGRAEIEGAVKRLYGALASPGVPEPVGGQRRRGPRASHQSSGATALELGRLILSPVAGKLSGKRLAIVADGLLQYIPFSVLVDPASPNEPLTVNHEIVGLPSASVLSELRSDSHAKTSPSKTSPSKTIAVFADPVFDRYDSRLTSSNRAGSARQGLSRRRGGAKLPLGNSGDSEGPTHFPRLAFAKQEADDIRALVPPDDRQLFLGLDANKTSALADQTGQYRILHFATHAVLDNSHPDLSTIVLSLVDKEGNPVDGFLRLNQIYNMKLGAGLVVLSACQTALGESTEGEGLIGLTRGFMYAGASRVVASLWEVDDQATEELMKHFYEGLLKRHLTASEALREAQMSIRSEKQWQAPYYWAGFVLQGDWK